MVNLTDHPDGFILPVKAQPRASKNAIRGEAGGMLKVAVTQVAEKGKANEAIIAVLAAGLNLRRSQIELLSGATQSQKRFLIRDIPRSDLEHRLQSALSPE